MIPRTLEYNIHNSLDKGKLIIIFGPRQTGKTTLVNRIAADLKRKTLFLDCDTMEAKTALSTTSLNRLQDLVGNNKLVIIDEAQRVRDIGMTLKILADHVKTAQYIVTGSSALELSNMVNEPLTGRKFEFYLYPFSSSELKKEFGSFDEQNKLEKRLIFGMYPEVVNARGDEADVLRSLASSFLYIDIFNYQDIRKPELLENLLKALALQIASEVSYNELARTLGTDKETISRYIQLLEKTFVIFRLNSFNRNLRTELKRSRKIYFFDNGIRNACLSNFNQLEKRTDIGSLWENYLVSERMKCLHYNNMYARSYFWRTKQQQEIDYIEEYDGSLHAYEFKWSAGGKTLFPKPFTNAYDIAETRVISRDNYWDFIELKSD